MKRIKHNDLIPWFTQDHGTLPKAYLESCQKFFLELDRRAASRKHQATSLTSFKLQDKIGDRKYENK